MRRETQKGGSSLLPSSSSYSREVLFFFLKEEGSFSLLKENSFSWVRGCNLCAPRCNRADLAFRVIDAALWGKMKIYGIQNTDFFFLFVKTSAITMLNVHNHCLSRVNGSWYRGAPKSCLSWGEPCLPIEGSQSKWDCLFSPYTYTYSIPHWPNILNG